MSESTAGPEIRRQLNDDGSLAHWYSDAFGPKRLCFLDLQSARDFIKHRSKQEGWS